MGGDSTGETTYSFNPVPKVLVARLSHPLRLKSLDPTPWALSPPGLPTDFPPARRVDTSCAAEPRKQH